MQLELRQLKIDGGTQPRVAIDEDVVSEYAEALREGASFPPVVAFHDGASWWLADGFHRFHAHRRAGLEKIEADVREGTLRDAILFAVGANTGHGLRRTNEDKRKAVTTLLTNEAVSTDEKGNPWSNGEIAKRCGVTHPFVRKIRDDLAASLPAGSLETDSSENGCGRRAYTTKHGTKAVMKTGKIGRGSTRRARGAAGVSPDAFKPVRPHSHHFARTALELPHDPRLGARAIVSALGMDYAVSLAREITLYSEGVNA